MKYELLLSSRVAVDKAEIQSLNNLLKGSICASNLGSLTLQLQQTTLEFNFYLPAIAFFASFLEPHKAGNK